MYIIFATVVNDQTGETRSDCMQAPFLLGAIHREYDLKYDAPSRDKAIQIVLANPSRVFHFSNQAAIDKLPSLTEQRNQQFNREACALVRQGKSVFLMDATGSVAVNP
jgi:hypothetical protein